jgi:MFS family permease
LTSPRRLDTIATKVRRISTLRNTAVESAAGPSVAVPTQSLYTPQIVALCVVGLLGFGSQFLIQPILPILVLERGGDATTVGLIIAAFSFPSVILRPFMGRLVDEWSNRHVLALGTGGIGLTGFLYLVPNLGAIFANRILHGAAWSAFNAAGHSMVARLAPAGRRGEAASVYVMMAGIAQTVMPAIGLLLFGVTGTSGPFVLAAVMGIAATAVIVLGPLPVLRPVAAPTREGFWRSLFEPGAVVPMGLEFLFTSVSALFLIYPAIWATSRQIPLEQLALYYPVYGVVLVGLRLISGRYIDRAPRRPVIAAGAGLAIVALVIAAGAQDVPMLTVGGAIYAAAASFTSPAAMAMAIDQSDPRRMGAAMATYTLGFQLALGVGAAIWGWMIDLYGYPAPYFAALLVEVALLAVLGLSWYLRRGGGTSGAGGQNRAARAVDAGG